MRIRIETLCVNRTGWNWAGVEMREPGVLWCCESLAPEPGVLLGYQKLFLTSEKNPGFFGVVSQFLMVALKFCDRTSELISIAK
ncbi:MAG TPA: hypothetical protein V6D29_23495 [Leptolyngbyaceae cyanobacterium]